MLRPSREGRNTRFLIWTRSGARTSFRSFMRPVARTPEELEELFEDAFVTHDAEAVSRMFAQGAVLALCDGPEVARGSDEISRLVTAVWEGDRTYVAEPCRVVQARDTPSSSRTGRSTSCAAAATGPGGTRSRCCLSIPLWKRRSDDTAEVTGADAGASRPERD